MPALVAQPGPCLAHRGDDDHDEGDRPGQREQDAGGVQHLVDDGRRRRRGRCRRCSPAIVNTMWASIRLNEVKPTRRWTRASSSWPQACSTSGMRAMSSTCRSMSTEASRPVRRPRLIRLSPADVKAVRPPPDTQSATTKRTAAQPRAAEASRHHRGVRRVRRVRRADAATGTEVLEVGDPGRRVLSGRTTALMVATFEPLAVHRLCDGEHCCVNPDAAGAAALRAGRGPRGGARGRLRRWSCHRPHGC